jgi:hypothetical protein
VEGDIQGKHLNYTLIRRTVTGFNLFEIILERWNKNKIRNCCLYNTKVASVRALSEDKQYLVKFKSIITSGLLKLTPTLSEAVPCRGIITGKL